MTTTTPEANNTVNSKRSAQIKRLRAFRIPVLVGLTLLAFETARAPFAAQPTESEVAQAAEEQPQEPAVAADTFKKPDVITIDATVVSDETESTNDADMPAALRDETGEPDSQQTAAVGPADDPQTAAGGPVQPGLDAVAAIVVAEQAKQAVWSGLAQFGNQVEQSFKESVVRAHQAANDDAQPELAGTADGAGDAASGNTDAASDGNVATALDELVLVNPQSSGVEIFFLIDGKVESLLPGQSRSFQGGTARLVQFHRGGDFGDAQFQLTGGVYEFRTSSSGWDLGEAAAK